MRQPANLTPDNQRSVRIEGIRGLRWPKQRAACLFRVTTCRGIVFGVQYHIVFSREYAYSDYSGKPRVSFCWLSQLAQKASRALLEHGQIHTKLGWTAARPWSTSARCWNRHFMQAVREWGAARPHSSCIGVRWYSMVTAKSIFRVATCSGIVFGISYHFLNEYAWWPRASHRYHFADLLSSSSTSAWPLVCCWSVAYLPLSPMPCFPRHCLTAYKKTMRLRWRKGRSKEQRDA